ncbi:hypothetical protein CK203_103222 [Vitis vinifera]|uniref:Uncharacterized protein n=2 Tax=Vitis vinifera TaxID=29760 RepID=A5B3B8_VITVI|nr:hypothetical protein CK203_103222 [Vitis vinifera]CAN67477.1 hypothetical protein VITISV_006418 [Vitis vinifera]
MRRPPTTPGASTSCPKRSVRHPPTKKAKVSGPRESSTPPQPQSPATEFQIPSRMTPKAIIRRPMVTQPPIEGNLNCRARSFHFKLCFDMETFKQKPKLRDSFRLLQKYHLEHLMTPRDFFYPRVALDFYQSMTTHRMRNPNVIHFTIDRRHGILGARHIAEALHIPYEPVSPTDFKEWSHFSQRDVVCILSMETSTRSFLLRKELPPGMLLVDVVLRSNIFPLQHMLECRRICRELFTLDKRNHLTAYVAPQGSPDMLAPPKPPQDEQPPQTQQAQQAEIPIEIIPPAPPAPSTLPTPEATSSAPPTTPEVPPVVPVTSSPPPSESSITISTSKFRGLCHTLQTLSTTQEPTAPPEEATPAKQTMPHEETTTVEVETPIQSTQETTVESLSPHDPPTTT